MATPKKSKSRKTKPEIVVFSLVGESACDECDSELPSGEYLTKRQEQGLCMECAGLGDLCFLPRGDAALTRRAGKYSRVRAVVVRWARARKRYERQGLLVEESALVRAEAECLGDADARARERERAAIRRARVDREYATRFAERIREVYPRCPLEEARAIAEWTCRKHTGRIGRSAAAKSLEESAVILAVRAHVRHRHTNYDDLLYSEVDRAEARERVHEDVDRVLVAWGAPI